jgi:hypothetical protein
VTGLGRMGGSGGRAKELSPPQEQHTHLHMHTWPPSHSPPHFPAALSGGVSGRIICERAGGFLVTGDEVPPQ